MKTNYDAIKEIVEDKNKLIAWLLDNGLPDRDLVICDTDKCPYVDRCHENADRTCELDDVEELQIWLDLPAK